MPIQFVRSDLWESFGHVYTAAAAAKIASIGSGYTFTGLDVNGIVFFSVTNSATDTATWENAPVTRPATISLETVPSGSGYTTPSDANWNNTNFSWIENIGADGLVFASLSGSTNIGSSYIAEVKIKFREQRRLLAATDFWLQIYTQDSTAPAMAFTGVATVWYS